MHADRFSDFISQIFACVSTRRKAAVNSRWRVPDELARSQRVFFQLQDELAEKYPGQWVAFLDGELVGHGSDDQELRESLDPDSRNLSSLFIEHVDAIF